jgi:methionyl-tRNA formyltransferase
MLKKKDGRIDWSQSAEEIDRQVRGLNPWPGTWTLNQDVKRIKILKVELSDIKSEEDPGTILDDGLVTCGAHSTLKILTLQPENKKPMDIKTALNGSHIQKGDLLS